MCLTKLHVVYSSTKLLYIYSAAAEAPKRGGYRQPNNNICLHV